MSHPARHNQTEVHTGSDALLDAAELAFAQHGFDGVGMKTIALGAGVSQALLHYHFGTKDGLYRAVIGRRATAINTERAALLDAVDFSQPDALRAVFHAFLAPPLGGRGGGQAFARLFAGLVGGGARDRVLIEEFYEETATRFVRALQAVRPEASRLDAARAYTMALGALAIALSGDARIWRLAGEAAPRHDSGVLETLITHACGGYEALIAEKDT